MVHVTLLKWDPVFFSHTHQPYHPRFGQRDPRRSPSIPWLFSLACAYVVGHAVPSSDASFSAVTPSPGTPRIRSLSCGAGDYTPRDKPIQQFPGCCRTNERWPNANEADKYTFLFVQDSFPVVEDKRTASQTLFSLSLSHTPLSLCACMARARLASRSRDILTCFLIRVISWLCPKKNLAHM